MRLYSGFIIDFATRATFATRSRRAHTNLPPSAPPLPLIAVALLHDAEKLIVVALRFEQIIIGEFAPFLFDLALEIAANSL
jgi:hypothetical protein